MNKYLKELLWLGVPLVMLFFFINPFWGNDTIDINVHETYYVIDKSMLFGLYIILEFFIYLFRILISRYNNIAANIIFLIFNATIIYLLTQAILFIDQMSSGWTIYPPLSAMNEEPQTVVENPLEIYLRCTQILFILLLTFTAFKTGQKFNRINKEN